MSKRNRMSRVSTVSEKAVRRLAVAAAVTSLVGSACGDENRYVAPPPPEVTVAHPVAREVTTYLEYTGNTAAVEAVEVRARVQGTLQSMHFVPGTDLKKGDLLFVIEPELYQARVDQAQADLQSARAQFRAAEEQLAITKAIFERKAGSKADLVARQQGRDQAAAAVEQAEANLAAAKLDLSYTHIYSPIDGRIDRNYVDVGNLVGAGEPTLLSSIVRQNPIYAYFEASERDVLLYRELDRRGQTATADGQRAEAYMALTTEQGFPHVGEVDYASNRVDPSTGTFEARAIFPNPEGIILPGLFVRLRVPFTRGRELLVPEEALGSDEGGRYVLLVDEKNVVQRRRVAIADLIEGMRVVRSGIDADDWVVVNGLQRARPGTPVTPMRTDLQNAMQADASRAGHSTQARGAESAGASKLGSAAVAAPATPAITPGASGGPAARNGSADARGAVGNGAQAGAASE